MLWRNRLHKIIVIIGYIALIALFTGVDRFLREGQQELVSELKLGATVTEQINNP